MSSADALWASLQSSTAEEEARIRERFHAASRRKEGEAAKLDKASKEGDGDEREDSADGESSTTSSTAVVREEKVEEEKVRPELQRLVAKFSDSGVPSRDKKRAIEETLSILSRMRGEALQRVVENLVGKELMKAVCDKTERVRDAALDALLIVTESLIHIEPFLQYLFPVISDRTLLMYEEVEDPTRPGQMIMPEDFDYTEKGENLREKLLRLAHLVTVSSIRSSLPYLREIVDICVSGLHDECAEVVVEAADFAFDLAKAVKKEVIKPFISEIVTVLGKVIRHKIAKVRVHGLHALQVCIHKGAAELIPDFVGWTDPNMLNLMEFYHPKLRRNTFALLIADSSSSVREAFYDLLRSWLTELTERLDYEGKLLPYLISGVMDDIPSLQSFCMEAIETIGYLWEKDQANDEKFLQYKRYGHKTELNMHAEAVSRLLPPPFCGKRPSYGARVTVRGEMRRVIKPIVAELEDWKEENRRRTIRLLKTLLYFGEEHMTEHCLPVAIALGKSLCVDDAEVVKGAKECCHILGRYTDPSVFVPFVLREAELVAGDDPAVAAGRIQAVAEALSTMATRRVAAMKEFIVKGVQVLPLLWSPSRAISASLWQLLSTLIEKAEKSQTSEVEDGDDIASPLDDAVVSFNKEEAVTLAGVALHLCSVMKRDGSELLASIGNLTYSGEEDASSNGDGRREDVKNGLSRLASVCGGELLEGTADAMDTVSLLRTLGPYLAARDIDALRKRTRGWLRKKKVSAEVLAMLMQASATAADGVLQRAVGKVEKEQALTSIARLLSSTLVPFLLSVVRMVEVHAEEEKEKGKRKEDELTLGEVKVVRRAVQAYIRVQSVTSEEEEGRAAAVQLLIQSSNVRLSTSAAEERTQGGDEDTTREEGNDKGGIKAKTKTLHLFSSFFDVVAPADIERRAKDRQEYIDLKVDIIRALHSSLTSAQLQHEYKGEGQSAKGEDEEEMLNLAVKSVSALLGVRKEDGHDEVRKVAADADALAEALMSRAKLER